MMKYRALFTRLTAGAIALLLAAPAFAQSATRTQLTTASPSRVGQSVAMVAEVDALAGGAPTGSVAFADGVTNIGAGALSVIGAGQATLSSGLRHSCALTNIAGVKCWGSNAYGQLGDGTLISRPNAAFVPGLGGIVAVAVGAEHSCALTALGAVRCWGGNAYGQLGNGTTTNSMTPTPVAGLQSGVVAIAAGEYHNCALTNAGVVMCWGYNSYGVLGNGATNTGYTPTAVAGPAAIYTAIAAGERHTCAITSTGALRCWGYNGNGELGDGTGVNRYVPTQVFGLTTGVTAVTAGGSHSCAIGSAGALKCWGYNYYGQVGDGSTANRLAPVAVVGMGAYVAAVDAGSYHSCALMTGGAARCWGRNYYGELGDGTTTSRLTPWPVSLLGGGGLAVSVGQDHSCVVLNNRVTRCWGYNYYGQIGDGTNTNRLLPVSVTGMSGMLRARARFATTTLTTGWHLLKASYAGDATHNPSSITIPHWVQ